MPSVTKTSRYEKGSLLQRILDPFAGAERLENGTLFVKVEDSDLNMEVLSEERLRAEYEKLKSSIECPLEGDEENFEEVRLAMLSEMEESSPFSLDEFNSVLDKEFSVFRDGEKYDYIKDLKDAYKTGLAKSSAEKIFDTLPDHVFWDIKLPQVRDEQRFMNPYNSFRKYHVQSFFDAREYEHYMARRTKKQNIDDAVSTYRRY